MLQVTLKRASPDTAADRTPVDGPHSFMTANTVASASRRSLARTLYDQENSKCPAANEDALDRRCPQEESHGRFGSVHLASHDVTAVTTAAIAAQLCCYDPLLSALAVEQPCRHVRCHIAIAAVQFTKYSSLLVESLQLGLQSSAFCAGMSAAKALTRCT